MATKQQKTYAIGASIAALGLGYLLLRKNKQPLFITAGGTFEGFGSQMFQVRLPRGDYIMMGGDGLTLQSQGPKGDMQDLQILINDTDLPFTVTPTFIDQTDDNNQHGIIVKVIPMTGS